jgi:hypothetical protein
MRRGKRKKKLDVDGKSWVGVGERLMLLEVIAVMCLVVPVVYYVAEYCCTVGSAVECCCPSPLSEDVPDPLMTEVVAEDQVVTREAATREAATREAATEDKDDEPPPSYVEAVA